MKTKTSKWYGLFYRDNDTWRGPYKQELYGKYPDPIWLKKIKSVTKKSCRVGVLDKAVLFV